MKKSSPSQELFTHKHGMKVHDFRNSQNVSARERAAPTAKGLGSLADKWPKEGGK